MGYDIDDMMSVYDGDVGYEFNGSFALLGIGWGLGV